MVKPAEEKPFIRLEDIRQAAGILEGEILPTPLIASPRFGRQIQGEVYLKLENLQKTGSFKIRGAAYSIRKRFREIGPRGALAVSAGNHGQGVALAARQAGIPATILMPEGSSLTKQAATRGYGGRVVLQGKTLSETIEKAREMAGDGFTFIHPFDDRDIMAGQGTIGLEILQELPNPDWVIVPVGGGGLISGMAVAIKALSPGTRILGVQSAACPAVLRSLEQGARVEVAPVRTIADGIAVRQPGRNTFPVMQALVDEFCLVEEDRIAEAILDLLEHKRILAEGAGAVPVAALKQLSQGLLRGRRVVLVISGGNLDLPVLDRVLRQGLLRQGRVARLTVQLEDVPGALAGLLSHVARLEGNILHIHHQRSEAGQDLFSTRVILELETRGPDHAVEIRESLAAAGFAVMNRSDA